MFESGEKFKVGTLLYNTKREYLWQIQYLILTWENSNQQYLLDPRPSHYQLLAPVYLNKIESLLNGKSGRKCIKKLCVK